MTKLLFALAALSATTPLAASERDGPQVARIRYADLDLSSIAGKATFDRRIEHALRIVCSDDAQAALDKRLQEIRCRRAAMVQIATRRDRLLASAAARNVSPAIILAERVVKPASSPN